MNVLEERKGEARRERLNARHEESRAEGEARGEQKREARGSRAKQSTANRKRERERASNASLNRLRGAADERVGNARVNRPLKAKRQRGEGERPRAVLCAAAAEEECEARKRGESRVEKNARDERAAAEKVSGRDEEKDLRRSRHGEVL